MKTHWSSPVHWLYVDPYYKPFKQKKSNFSDEKGEPIREKVRKLLGQTPYGNCYSPHGFRMWYQVVDLLDALRGYLQIFMAEEDVEKTTFVTEYGIYSWKFMPFGLKNFGATYQRMVNKVFSTHIGRNMEIYVCDMLIKSRKASDHEDNLRESFENPRRYEMAAVALGSQDVPENLQTRVKALYGKGKSEKAGIIQRH
ncbi:hypothetical protein LIER_42594 [Lithospermum erythrorhizon]|uniref:Reverse transcriptase domain-containing protein n=1 Tax=Lithospermum erythrorhizon TaxID=34254 RepID=A0AAV3NPM7_LITER